MANNVDLQQIRAPSEEVYYEPRSHRDDEQVRGQATREGHPDGLRVLQDDTHRSC